MLTKEEASSLVNSLMSCIHTRSMPPDEQLEYKRWLKRQVDYYTRGIQKSVDYKVSRKYLK